MGSTEKCPRHVVWLSDWMNEEENIEGKWVLKPEIFKTNPHSRCVLPI